MSTSQCVCPHVHAIPLRYIRQRDLTESCALRTLTSRPRYFTSKLSVTATGVPKLTPDPERRIVTAAARLSLLTRGLDRSVHVGTRGLSTPSAISPAAEAIALQDGRCGRELASTGGMKEAAPQPLGGVPGGDVQRGELRGDPHGLVLGEARGLLRRRSPRKDSAQSCDGSGFRPFARSRELLVGVAQQVLLCEPKP